MIKQLENLKGGERASRKYLECHNKEIQKNGKSQLHRKKALLEEKPLSSGSTLTLQGILVNPNNRLKIGTTGDISSLALILNKSLEGCWLINTVMQSDQKIQEASCENTVLETRRRLPHADS